MIYILSVIFNIIVILLFNRYDKNKSLAKDWQYTGRTYDEWLAYYKGGRSKIYIIFMLISLIPYVNVLISICITAAIVAIYLWKFINKINELITK